MTRNSWFLLFASVLLVGMIGTASALPVSQVQGTNWKNECIKEGGSRYACCKRKETDCREGCQSGSTCGNACTQCKNECSASYSVCTAKALKLPPGVRAPTTAPATKAQ